MKRDVTGIDVRRDAISPPAFLRLERLTCRNLYDDGTSSRQYASLVLHRRGFDSVAILPYWIDPTPKRLMVVVARGIRPAAYMRHSLPVPHEEQGTGLYTWEAVAGSLEPGDTGEDGIDRRAVAELLEETGFRVTESAIERLGPGFLPSHGQSTEKIHLRAARVDPAKRGEPRGDGSVGEEDARIEIVEASEMLELCEGGEAQDPKIEIGIRRLCRRLGFLPELSAWEDELPEKLRDAFRGR